VDELADLAVHHREHAIGDLEVDVPQQGPEAARPFVIVPRVVLGRVADDFRIS
jgi:hypothetical protein